MIRDRLVVPRFAEGGGAALVSAIAVSYCVGVVALFASAKIDLSQAELLLGAPVVLAVAILRPEWTILILVGLPPSGVTPIPPMQLVAVMLTTLFGFLLRGGLRLGPRTGVYPLVGLIVLAIAVKGDTSAAARATADGMLKTLVFYTFLMLVAVQTGADRRFGADTFVNALLVGIVAGAILQPFAGGAEFQSIIQTPYRGQFAYLAVMGFGVTYVRFSLRRAADREPAALDVPLMVIFFCLTAIGFGRATWVAGLWVFALVAMWTGRKAFWIVAALVLALVFTAPVIGERVLPGSSGGLADVTLAQATTGRSELWEILLDRSADAPTWGNGWGYTWSLTSTELFGFEGAFGAEGRGYVFPHNDFLFLFMELGILGFGLLVAFWLHLLRDIRVLSRSSDEQTRYGVRLLVPIVIVMFLVQMFDNGFAIRFVAVRFFIAAGLIFGVTYLRRSERFNVGSGSPGTSRGIAPLAG